MSDQRLDGGKKIKCEAKENDGIEVVVSVIIASYNCVDTIEDAILSVIGQDFNSKELIVVDGGSTDGTVDVIKAYDDVIYHWVSEADNGVYDALNKGIGFSRGSWLYFLGADDKLFNNSVFSQIFSRSIAGKMIYGNVILIGNGVVGNDGDVYDGEFNKFKLCQKNICHQAIFYNKKLFHVIGKYDLIYPVLSDWEFNIRAFGMSTTHPAYVDKIISLYNAEGKSSRKHDSKFYEDYLLNIRKNFGSIYYWFNRILIIIRRNKHLLIRASILSIIVIIFILLLSKNYNVK